MPTGTLTTLWYLAGIAIGVMLWKVAGTSLFWHVMAAAITVTASTGYWLNIYLTETEKRGK